MKKTPKRRFVVDLAGVRSAARLHAVLAETLPLPEQYGRNLLKALPATSPSAVSSRMDT